MTRLIEVWEWHRMFAPKEIAQNALMGFGLVRRVARNRHRTGVLSDPVRGRAVFERLRILAGGDLSHFSFLELGPGRGTELMRPAAAEAARYAAFDIEPYLDPDDVVSWGVDYRTGPGDTLPWDDGSFDVVWSHSVYEHLRNPATLVAEVARVLRPGGLQIAIIDLEDHYGDRRTPERIYGFLQYGDRLWWAMTSNRSAYCNRLRASHWRRLFDDQGFEILSEETEPPKAPLADLRAVGFHVDVSDADLMAARVAFTTCLSQVPG